MKPGSTAAVPRGSSRAARSSRWRGSSGGVQHDVAFAHVGFWRMFSVIAPQLFWVCSTASACRWCRSEDRHHDVVGLRLAVRRRLRPGFRQRQKIVGARRIAEPMVFSPGISSASSRARSARSSRAAGCRRRRWSACALLSRRQPGVERHPRQPRFHEAEVHRDGVDGIVEQQPGAGAEPAARACQ